MEKQAVIVKKSGYHHGDLRAQLVEATRYLVELKGPDNFSVAEACRKAGVSTAAPYKHFRDRTEMLHAVIVEGMERQRCQMIDALKEIPFGSPDRITALGRVYINFAQNEPGVFRLMFGLSDAHGDDKHLIDQGNNLFGIVIDTVAQCLGRVTRTETDAQRAFMLWSFVHGLSFITIDGKVSEVGIDVNIDQMLTEITRRIIPECFTA